MAYSATKPTRALSQRIAEEAQLLAEEKWIIDALKKIKMQRNALAIERLQLESIKGKILARAHNKNQAPEAGSSSAEAAMSDAADKEPFDIDEHMRNMTDIDDPSNLEELNLTVTDSVFKSSNPYGGCDEEEEDEDLENCLLDIDLLMSGK
ncbi:uncharacterized protein LOC142982105 isoform X2 [Anticarsia gemmatalis]